MAEGKNSFTMYCDWKDVFETLPPEKAGELIVHILRYVNDENPHTDDLLIKAVFAPIKATLKRDLKKWEAKCQKNRENVRKRWEKNNTTVYERIRPDTKNTDSDSDSDSDNNNVVTKNGEADKNPYERERPDVDNARDVLAEIENNAQWWDMLSRKVRKDADPKKLLNEFIAHNRLHEKGDMRYKDFKSYFRNWINKQIELKNKELEKLLIYP